MAPGVHDLGFMSRRASFLLRLPTLTLHRGRSLFLHGPSRERQEHAAQSDRRDACCLQAGVELLGQPLPNFGRRRDSAIISAIFQQFNLPYLSVLDNVLLPCLLGPSGQAGQDPQAESPASAQRPRSPDPGFVAGLPGCAVGRSAAAGRGGAGMIGQPEILMADEPFLGARHGHQMPCHPVAE